jgi:gluconolactonase
MDMAWWLLAGAAIVPALAAFAAAATGAAPPKIFPDGAVPEKIAGGCKFTEGPAADADGSVYFSDGPNDRIMVYTPDGTLRVWKHGTRSANGMEFDAQGRLVTCNSEGAPNGRTVTRYEKDGSVTVLADRFAFKKLNSPNDLCFDKKGRIYFTDPRYGELTDIEQDKMAVYRIDTDGAITRVVDDVQVPNGILLSEDERTLYVADNSPAADGPHTLLAYDLRDGKGKGRKVLYDLGKERGIDGMVMDVRGNIYATAGLGEKTGVYVISPEGALLYFLRTPETATNCTFGGPDLKTLYITAGESLYRVRTEIPGRLTWPSLPKAQRERNR